MGMFDSFYGKVSCPHCNHENMVEIQFKWSDCLLLDYELGDIVSGAPDGIYIETDDWEHGCEKCVGKFIPSVVLRNGKVIKFLNNVELENVDIDKLPDVEDKIAKKEKYMNDVKWGKGRTKETLDFKLNPLSIGDKITALENEWIIKEVYKKEIDGNYRFANLIRLRGMLGRNSDIWYVYKVENEEIGERWIEVEDRRPTYSMFHEERTGNMVVSINYDLNEDGYIVTKIG
jgi:hypothetical protein